MIPDVAIGAVIAALIGATISLVGLIVAKEGKISEFRQAWIDALRGELSAFLTSVNTVADARNISFKDDKERFKTLQPSYDKLNETYYLIALRLNSHENESKSLKSCMVKLSNIIMDFSDFDFDKFDKSRVDFIRISNSLLKSEWTRVKSGEPAYRMARLIASVSTIAAIILALALAFGQFSQRTKSSPSLPPATKTASGVPIPPNPQHKTVK